MVPRLWLSAVAPPSLARAGLVYLAAEVGPYRSVPRLELVAAGEGLSRTAELLMQALPDGSLYLRSAWTWPDIHSLVARSLVSVVDLVIWDMLVSHRYLSGTSLQRAPSAAALANSSAFSLPVVPVCAVCGDPARGDLVVSAQGSGAGLHGRDGEALAGANGVHPYTVDCGREI